MNTAVPPPHQEITILAFDTSGDEASVALWLQGTMRTLPLRFGTGNQTQAARLVPAMQALLEEACLTFQEIDIIATPVGPGSFTGIRLGLATAQGLLLSTRAQSFAPTTLEVGAFEAWQEKRGASADHASRAAYLITLTTKRESFYTQAFDSCLTPLSTAAIQTEEEIQAFLAANPDVYRWEQLSSLSAESLISLYFYRREEKQALPSLFHPYYLHDPEFVKQKL